MRFASESAWALSLRLLSFTAAAITGVLTARLLGPAGRGLYQLPIIATGVAVAFCSGLTTAVAYEVAKRSPGPSLSRLVIRAVGAFSLAGIGTGLAASALLGQWWLVMPIVFFTPFAAASAAASGYWLGTRRIRVWSSLGAATSVATCLLTGIGLAVFGRRVDVAIAAWVGGAALVAIASAALTLRDLRRREHAADSSSIIGFAVKAGGTNVVTLLNYRVDVFIVAAWTTPSILGAYSVALAVAESMLAFAQTIGAVLAPRLAAAPREMASHMTERAVRGTLALVSLACIIIAAIARPLVIMAFGDRFAPSVAPLQLLMPGIAALSVGGILSAYFSLHLGRPSIPLRIAAASAACCAFMTLFSVPRYGIAGAASATSITYCLGQIVALAMFCRIAQRPLASVVLLQREDITRFRHVLKSALGRLTKRGSALPATRCAESPKGNQ